MADAIQAGYVFTPEAAELLRALFHQRGSRTQFGAWPQSGSSDIFGTMTAWPQRT